MKEDPVEEMKRLKGELKKALVDINNSLAAGSGQRQNEGKNEKKCCLKNEVCYGCGKKGHVKSRCPRQAKAKGQGNMSQWLDR